MRAAHCKKNFSGSGNKNLNQTLDEYHPRRKDNGQIMMAG
jgi:hypothetical protein